MRERKKIAFIIHNFFPANRYELSGCSLLSFITKKIMHINNSKLKQEQTVHKTTLTYGRKLD